MGDEPRDLEGAEERRARESLSSFGFAAPEESSLAEEVGEAEVQRLALRLVRLYQAGWGEAREARLPPGQVPAWVIGEGAGAGPLLLLDETGEILVFDDRGARRRARRRLGLEFLLGLAVLLACLSLVFQALRYFGDRDPALEILALFLFGIIPGAMLAFRFLLLVDPWLPGPGTCRIWQEGEYGMQAAEMVRLLEGEVARAEARQATGREPPKGPATSAWAEEEWARAYREEGMLELPEDR